jgi:hypothetical protein|tara:strand:+ start:345 stop:1196 length:852 start_codon:yes stop_codon:yes gene_type:complete
MTRSFTTALCLAAFAVAVPAAAQDKAVQTAPIIIGTTHLLEYAPGDQREINVFLPQGYEDGESYPVLYLIDGGLAQDFLQTIGVARLNESLERSRPAIIVGVQTKDRQAELLDTPGSIKQEREAFPTAGDGARFGAFLRDKVIPEIDAHYRTSGERAVLGESVAGLFIVNTWLDEPSLFTNYAAINPSLWWNQAANGQRAAKKVADGTERGRIYLTYSNEGPMTAGATTMVASAAAERGCLVPRPDLTHATTYQQVMPQALQYLFPTGTEFDGEMGFALDCAG